MPIVKQLSIFLENQPGTLSRVIHEFAANKVNLMGMTVSDTKDHAVVRMVVSHPVKALEILEEYGLLVLEGEVLQVDVPNKPGALAFLAGQLAKAEINIDYAYGTAPSESKKATLYLRVDDLDKARKVLENNGK